MSSLYALLVGIDEYQAVSSLRGCRNDVDRVRDFLLTRTAADREPRIRTLTDHDATRAALITGFRAHLGQAGPGDRALFWFSGHGSQVPVPRELWHLEPSGQSQTLVCADSRVDARPDLLDRELGVLISEVAARGVHVAAVLDCCHSAGGTRQAPRHEPDPAVAELIGLGAPLAARWVEPGPEHAVGALLPELSRGGERGVGPARRSDHVALAACRNHQVAYEVGRPGRRNGAFTAGLLDALGRLGPEATYRDLMVAARCHLENTLRQQVPVLYPQDPAMIDQPFLGGALHRPESPLVLRHVRGGWEINAGRLHGLAPAGAEEIRVALPGAGPLREARVLEVLTERSRVEPAGWLPDTGRQYSVVLSHAPLPSTTVVIGGRPKDDPDLAHRVTAALGAAGPGGTPSPYVRAVPIDEDAALRVSTSGGEIRVTGFDGTALTGDLAACGTAGVVARLEHIARWRTVKALTSTSSALADAVRLEVVPVGPGVTTAPRTGGAIAPAGPDEVVLLEYERRAGDWLAPQVFLRLRNTSGRRLYCVLLDLTDRYAIHPDLFPGDYVGAGQAAAAFDGDPVEFSLPQDRPVRPGAEVKDWIQLIVAEEEFGSDCFRLDPLGTRDATGASRSGPLSGVLDLLGQAAMHRIARRRPRSAYDWTTVLVPVVTRVPGQPIRSRSVRCPSDKDI